MKRSMNFSPNPFKRAGKSLPILWVLNPLLLVLVVALLLHWRGLKQSNERTHVKIDGLEEQGRDLDRDQARALKELADIDLTTYRKKVTQFNAIQAGFDTHWGSLLDDLSGQLPANVRILAIKPRSTRRVRDEGDQKIFVEAEARDKQSQLTFIRQLQAYPSFSDVQFETERYEKAGSGQILFEISFSFRKKGGRS